MHLEPMMPFFEHFGQSVRCEVTFWSFVLQILRVEGKLPQKVGTIEGITQELKPVFMEFHVVHGRPINQPAQVFL